MTRSLPFAVPPSRRMERIGNEDSGIIELPVCGGLLRKEREIVEELTRSDEGIYVVSARAAARIAESEGLSLSESLRVLQGGDMEESMGDIRLRHAELLQDVIKASMLENERHKMATITAMMRVRGGVPDWQLSDWDDQPDVIIDGIYALASAELAAEPKREQRMPTEEELGKSSAASGKPNRSTGKPASGN